VLDDELDGVDDLVASRVVFDDEDTSRFVVDEIKRLGPAEFSRCYDVPPRTTSGIANGRKVSTRTVNRVRDRLQRRPASVRRCALEGCEEPVTRPNATYCTPAHTKRASRFRVAVREGDGRADETSVVVCPGCGVTLLGVAATRGTCRNCMGESA
jgi:hypothetical protein